MCWAGRHCAPNVHLMVALDEGHLGIVSRKQDVFTVDAERFRCSTKY